MDKIVVLITTSDEDEAADIGYALVEEGLAACVNIVDSVRSIYRWKGETSDDTECLMVVKTIAGNFEALEKRVKSLHSYEVPEIIAIPIVKGSEAYLNWVEENTRLG